MPRGIKGSGKQDEASGDRTDDLRKLMNEKNREYDFPILKFASQEPEVTRISFGEKHIDELTGGGLPSRRFSIVWGPKGSAKSTICCKVIASAQKAGKNCAYFDLENTFEPIWATKQGVVLDKLVLGQGFANAEQAMDSFVQIVKSKTIDLVIFDSVQAMSPKGEQETKKGVEKSIEDDEMALLARKLSKFFRVSAGSVYRSNVTVLLVGQTRMNLGGFIALETLSGGHALQHWSSMTVHMGRGSKSDAPTVKVTNAEGESERIAIGFDCKIKLEKRKVESKPEGSTIHLPFYFDGGFKDEISIPKVIV